MKGIDGDMQQLNSMGNSMSSVVPTVIWVSFIIKSFLTSNHDKIDLYFVLGPSTVVEKYVPTIGWVEDSQLRQIFGIPQLLIIPLAYSSFFTTDPKKKSINKTLN